MITSYKKFVLRSNIYGDKSDLMTRTCRRRISVYIKSPIILYFRTSEMSDY